MYFITRSAACVTAKLSSLLTLRPAVFFLFHTVTYFRVRN